MRTRLYRSDADDLPRMLALVQQRWIEAQPKPWDLHPGDLLWQRFMHEDQISRWHERVVLWEENDRLLGFAEYFPKLREVGMFTLSALEPDAETVGRMLTDVRGLVLEFARENGSDEPISLSVWQGSALESTLRRLGLEPESRSPMRMNGLTLEDGNLPGAFIPEGWTIRPLSGAAEYAGRVEVHRVAFESTKATVDGYARMRTRPGYDPELDLAAVNAEGTIASYAIFWFDPVTKTGLVEPVGSLPEFRRRGLTRAVLGEGLRRLRDRGASRVYVNCTEDSPGACQLYESVGFQEVGWWRSYALAIGEAQRTLSARQ